MTQESLSHLIAQDTALQQLWEHVQTHMNQDPSHDAQHVLRVTRWTVRLAKEQGVPQRRAIVAGLLHDFINIPKDSQERHLASTYSAQEAQRLLKDFDFTPEEITAIADAIRDHSFSRGATPESALGKALQDADRLDALGAIGLFRTTTVGAYMKTSYAHPQDPWGISRTWDDKTYTVDHFFVKLLRLPQGMHTQMARKEAQRRTAQMWDFLEALGEQIGSALPEQRRHNFEAPL